MDKEKKNAENSQGQEALNEDNASLEAGISNETVDTEIVSQVQDSFLDYAMSVIVSRAIPDVRDGLKPVHRRVVYGMYDAGYTSDKPYVKCAKVVGDVMGKYHPHGDSAIYDTLVRLAQPFSMRYTLVDGHGNFGNMDGDEAAAYRYTECRMNKMAQEMVRDINLDTVDFVPNYDGSLEEPSVLPSRFPNLLVNGADGIAVGMATKLPSHNLGEVIDGLIALAHNPDIDTEGLMQYIKGPDFATGGIIYGLGGIREAYETGRGSFKIRSKTEIVEEDNGKSKIIVKEIPYQVRKGDLVTKIGELARDKVVEGITGIKDYSKQDVRIEIELRRDVEPLVILNKLFKLTQLEISFGVINLCIVDGAPKILSLKELLSRYLDFQIEVVRRRTVFLKKRDEGRLKIVAALLVAHDNIDEVVEMSKNSANPQDFTEKLKARFSFSDEQAKAIVQMTLGRLTGIETEKLKDEEAELKKNIEGYTILLSSRENLTEQVLKELEEIKVKYNDSRRSVISNTITSVDDEDLIAKDDIVIALTEKGYIKRMSSSEFKIQNRGGVGVKGLSMYSDDEVTKIVFSTTHTDVLFFTSLGRVYRKRGYEIPESSRIGRGAAVINLLNLDKDEKVISMISENEYDPNHFLLFATEQGIVKRTSLDQFERINNNGKYAITFKEGDNLLGVKETDGHSKVMLASSDGKLAMFEESEVRPVGRTAAGVRGMNLKDGDKLVGLSTSRDGDKIFVVSELGLGKLSPVETYRLTHRGSGGVITIKVTDKTGKLVAMRAVSGDEDYLAITDGGTVVRSPITQVRECGRNSMGVKLMNLKEKEKISSVAILPSEAEEEITSEETKEVEPSEPSGEDDI
jgi:DNA gyrase subunit A